MEGLTERDAYRRVSNDSPPTFVDSVACFRVSVILYMHLHESRVPCLASGSALILPAWGLDCTLADSVSADGILYSNLGIDRPSSPVPQDNTISDPLVKRNTAWHTAPSCAAACLARQGWLNLSVL